MKFSKLIPILVVIIIVTPIIWGIILFRQTFIPWYILLLPVVSGPFIIFPAIARLMKESKAGTWIMAVVYGAPLFYFLFLWVNYTFPKNNRLYTQTFKILKKGDMRGRSKTATPYIDINFEGREKQLVFDAYEAAVINRADSIEIQYYEGLLGYKAMKNYRFR